MVHIRVLVWYHFHTADSLWGHVSSLDSRWHVQPAQFNLGWTMTLGLLSGEGSHSRCTSSTPWSIFCPGLTRSMFFCSAVLAAQHALLTVPYYMFLSFIVCGILQLCESLRDTMVLYQRPPKLHFKNKMVPYQLHSTFMFRMWLWDCWEIHVHFQIFYNLNIVI